MIESTRVVEINEPITMSFRPSVRQREALLRWLAGDDSAFDEWLAESASRFDHKRARDPDYRRGQRTRNLQVG